MKSTLSQTVANHGCPCFSINLSYSNYATRRQAGDLDSDGKRTCRRHEDSKPAAARITDTQLAAVLVNQPSTKIQSMCPYRGRICAGQVYG